eukprot:scaffold237941_cov31-Tisochrysis_lutea.AAC.1
MARAALMTLDWAPTSRAARGLKCCIGQPAVRCKHEAPIRDGAVASASAPSPLEVSRSLLRAACPATPPPPLPARKWWSHEHLSVGCGAPPCRPSRPCTHQ